MPRETTAYLYVNERLRSAVNAGHQSIYLRLKSAVESCGWQFVMLPEEAREAAPQMDGYHIVNNRDVPGPFCLNLRRCYMDPFWRIEDSNDRWDFDVARQSFDASKVSGNAGRGFIERWQGYLFKGAKIRSDGFIFLPLQGKLLRQRHFQSMCPADMVRATIKADPSRPVVASLHPGETYEPEELAELRLLQAELPRFTLSDRPSIDLLLACDYVVTMNSGMALTGYFARKPAVLFGKIDFHHIAGSVYHSGPQRAFSTVSNVPDFGAYLFWFFRENAISMWSEPVEDQILQRLRRHGWPI